MAKQKDEATTKAAAGQSAAPNFAAPNTPDHVDLRQAQWARELPGLDTEPMAILGRANRIASLVRPSIEKTFAGFGLDRGEFDVIATLRRAGPPYRLIPTELYTSLMLSSGGLTHRLDRLEKRGLIARERSAKDGRSLPVALTPAGAALAEKAFRADMASELTFLDGLDAPERKALAELLKKLVMSIEQRGGE
ncbi:MAG TPA: MarR family transcriptional regulator [Rhizobiaceae bacterium]|nr:MarR family transcriptional regulator [Rhizobiaceae bacterium]